VTVFVLEPGGLPGTSQVPPSGLTAKQVQNKSDVGYERGVMSRNQRLFSRAKVIAFKRFICLPNENSFDQKEMFLDDAPCCSVDNMAERHRLLFHLRRELLPQP
jgi:hypothetical protein